MLKPKPPQTSFFMSGNYLYDRIVPTDHLLRKINQVVDFSFVHELVKDRYTPDFGRPAEDPEFMLRLCLLQYLYGDSDREVVANAKMHLAYKYFLGLAVDEEVPDDTTISYFRAKRLGEEKFRQVFQNIVQQCIDKGLVTGKRQIVDSTHIIADIAVTSLTNLVKLCRKNVIKEVEKQMPSTAKKPGWEDVVCSKEDRFARKEEHLDKELVAAKSLLDSVTDELKQGKLEVTPELAKDLELLEKAVGDREDGVKDRLVSPVDPDARMGKKDSKHWAGYKGHVVMEEDSEIITAIETTAANKADGNQLKGLLKQQESAHSLVPEEISGDKAYDSGANLELLDDKGITGNLSLTRKVNIRGTDLFSIDNFHYDAESDTVTCPAGCVARYSARSVFHSEDQQKRGRVFQFSRKQCGACHLREKCHRNNSKTRGRAVYISYSHDLFQRMRARMESEAGQEAYRQRYKIEHKVADLARWCGMRRCRYRGLTRAGIHTLLAAIVSNIKRMARLSWEIPEIPPPKLAAVV
ncbi:IS1182 family transposase [Chloroflexota bacterium]